MRIPHSQIKDRDTPHVPFYAPMHRGSRVHLFRSIESQQEIGENVEDDKHQYEH